MISSLAPTAVDAPPVASAEATSARKQVDQALVLAAAAGDSRAYEQLYRRHVGRIHALCCHLHGGDTARAEQATQDAFVRAWERLGSFRGDSEFGTWLHRLAVNVVLGEMRVLRRWIGFEEVADQGELSETPHTQLALRLDLEKALARLPPGARAVLVLHDVEGYRHEEIAELSGIAIGTSKAQLHRARRLMKEWLQ